MRPVSGGAAPADGPLDRPNLAAVTQVIAEFEAGDFLHVMEGLLDMREAALRLARLGGWFFVGEIGPRGVLGRPHGSWGADQFQKNSRVLSATAKFPLRE